MTTPDPVQPAAEAEAELASFMHRWADAIVTNDVDQIAAFTTDNWVLIDRPGAITRQAFHDVVATGQLRHDHMTHEVLGIDRYGPVAVVRTHGRNRGSFQGQPIEADEWTTNLLIEGPDGWRCVLTQLTPRDQPARE
jgi:ketosteroid isomerase-like protein